MPRKRKESRAARGMGSVYKWERRSKKGVTKTVWVAAIVYRDQQMRKHRMVAYADSQEAATDKLKHLQNRPEVRSQLGPSKGSVGEFIENWLSTVVDANLRSSTASTYRATYRAHIKEQRIAGLELSKTSSSDIDALYVALLRDAVGPRTRRKVHDLLASVFTYAMKRKQIAADPMFGVNRPAYSAPSVRALTKEQIDALLKAAAGDPLEALYVVTLFSGLRSGEVLSLTWGDVNLDTGVLTVGTSLRDTGAKGKGIPKRVVATTKTKGSSRPVPLPKIAVESLRHHLEKTPAARPSDLVFPNERGGPLWRQNLLRRSFYPLLMKAGLYEDGKPMITFHGLRHVHGTELFRQGIHPKVVQDRLGHSRIGITLDTYSSSVPSMQQAAVDSLDRAYPTRRRRTS